MNRVFRLGSRRRRVAFVSGLAAVIVLGMALPAWAHHPVLSGETECTNGDHVVTWSISNSQTNMPMTITSATAAIGVTEYPLTGYSSPVGNGGTTHATTIVPGNVTGTIVLTISGSWPDGVTSTKDTSVDLVDTCVQPTTTTTVGGTTTFATTTTTGGGTTTTTPITGEGSTIPTVVNQATTTAAAPVAGTLPRTGSSSRSAVFFGLSCIAGGALLLLRRRSWVR